MDGNICWNDGGELLRFSSGNLIIFSPDFIYLFIFKNIFIFYFFKYNLFLSFIFYFLQWK